jgi:hypothetical protein
VGPTALKFLHSNKLGENYEDDLFVAKDTNVSHPAYGFLLLGHGFLQMKKWTNDRRFIYQSVLAIFSRLL